jgi:hypothetical protein
MNDCNETGAKRLWQSQPAEIPPMSTAYLRHRASELERAFWWRNFAEQGSCALALLYCSIMLFAAPDHWLRASMALLIVGIGWGMYQWRRRVRERSSFVAAETGLAFYLRELEHKRDLYRTMWRWYLLPMLPGTVTLVAWGYVRDPGMKGTGLPWIGIGLVLAWTIHEQYKAARYQREIDALTANDAKPSARATD